MDEILHEMQHFHISHKAMWTEYGDRWHGIVKKIHTGTLTPMERMEVLRMVKALAHKGGYAVTADSKMLAKPLTAESMDSDAAANLALAVMEGHKAELRAAARKGTKSLDFWDAAHRFCISTIVGSVVGDPGDTLRKIYGEWE